MIHLCSDSKNDDKTRTRNSMYIVKGIFYYVIKLVYDKCTLSVYRRSDVTNMLNSFSMSLLQPSLNDVFISSYVSCIYCISFGVGGRTPDDAEWVGGLDTKKQTVIEPFQISFLL